ncbi:MAG: hypothetical protein ACEQSC_01555, partial [Candidatus Nanopelagicaceae bacterium]
FIENTYEKVRQLKALITKKGSATQIEIDGGVTNKNAKQLAEAVIVLTLYSLYRTLRGGVSRTSGLVG